MSLKQLQRSRVTARISLFFICIFLVIFFFPTHSLIAQETADQPIVAVPSINPNGVAEALASACRNMVETALVKTKQYNVMGYNDVEEVLEAQKFYLSGCADTSCAVEIGKLLAAEKIVVGELTGLGEGRMILSLRMVNVSTSRTEAAEIINIGSTDELQQGSFEGAYKLAGLRSIPGLDELRDQTAELYVTAPAGKTLEVFIDGESRGSTPLFIPDLSFGTHLIEAKEGAYHYQKEITVQSTETIEIVADVALLSGNMHLEVLPADASGYTVLLDGERIGTGLERDIPIGERSLSVSGGGYRYEGTVTIEQDETVQVSIQLQSVGKVFASYPPGGEAELRGAAAVFQLHPVTPIIVPTGRYRLYITHPDYLPFEQTLEVTRNETVAIAPDLEYTELYAKERELAEVQRRRENIIAKRKALAGWGFGSYGLAAASGGVITVFEILLAEEKKSLESAYESYSEASVSGATAELWSAVEAGKKKVTDYRLVRDLTFIGVGAGVVTGTILLLAMPPVKKANAEVKTLEDALDELREQRRDAR